MFNPGGNPGGAMGRGSVVGMTASTAPPAGMRPAAVSRATSPGRLRHQNFVVLSCDPLTRMCPAGCHARLKIEASWPPLISA